MAFCFLNMISDSSKLPDPYIHTYIRIIDLVSHTTYDMCVNFIHKTDFLRLFMAILFTLRVFARNVLRGSRRGYIFIFSF